MGGAWSCCLPCAGGGGGGGGVGVSGATPEAKKGSLLKHQQYQQPHQQQRGQQQQHEYQQQQKILQQEKQYHYQPPKRICVAQFKERAPLGDLDEDLDDDLDDEEKECELRIGEEEDYGREGGTQHRLSPRLHDIEEEDDEEGRHVRERSVINLVSRVSRFSLR